MTYQGHGHVHATKDTSFSRPFVFDLVEHFQKFLASTICHVCLSQHRFAPSSSGIYSHIWILDSGALHYMSFDFKSFVCLYPTSHVSIMIVDCTPIPLAGTRSISTSHFSISNVYYIPNLTLNFVFVSQLCNFRYQFFVFLLPLVICRIYNQRRLIRIGHRQG